jgi:hypothetical protein
MPNSAGKRFGTPFALTRSDAQKTLWNAGVASENAGSIVDIERA